MDDIKAFASHMLQEDMGRGDIFKALDIDTCSEAVIIAKEEGILSGVAYAEALAELCHIQITWHIKQKQAFCAKDHIATLKGSYHDLLIVERSLLNVLQHSSGIATLTKRYIQALNDPHILLLDTRKTRPLLRAFEKRAVRDGGGCNHRFGIDDCLMIKDTHRALLGDLKDAVAKIKRVYWTILIEVESQTLEEFKEAIEADIDIAMCDNMDIETIKQCIAYKDEYAPHIRIEVSGNITLDNIHLYRGLNIDAISVGAITHHATFIDLSMKMSTVLSRV